MIFREERRHAIKWRDHVNFSQMTRGVFLLLLFHFNFNKSWFYSFYRRFLRKTDSDTQRQNCCQNWHKFYQKSKKTDLTAPLSPFSMLNAQFFCEIAGTYFILQRWMWGRGESSCKGDCTGLDIRYVFQLKMDCIKSFDNKFCRWVSELQWPQ